MFYCYFCSYVSLSRSCSLIKKSGVLSSFAQRSRNLVQPFDDLGKTQVYEPSATCWNRLRLCPRFRPGKWEHAPHGSRQMNTSCPTTPSDPLYNSHSERDCMLHSGLVLYWSTLTRGNCTVALSVRYTPTPWVVSKSDLHRPRYHFPVGERLYPAILLAMCDRLRESTKDIEHGRISCIREHLHRHPIYKHWTQHFSDIMFNSL